MGMRDVVLKILKLSRFRFWIYAAGPYVIGYSLGASGFADFLKIEYYIYLVYFFIPANILIYGINDYFDTTTDLINPKKDEKELRVMGLERRRVGRLVAYVIALSIGLMLFQDNIARLLFGGFLFLSIFYSAPPLRFKSKPFIDFLSNYLYIMPGVFGYYIASGGFPHWSLLLAGLMHISAMHIFSAIPDVDYDRRAGLKTTPVFLGVNFSLIMTFVFWSVLSYLVITLTNYHPLSFLVIIYPLIPVSVAVFKRDIERVYWLLPYINTSLGGLLWLGIVNYKIIPFFPSLS